MSTPTPAHEKFVQNCTRERNEQAPLGPEPSYDDVLDVGVEYTFPASDPVSVDSSAGHAEKREAASAPDSAAGEVWLQRP
ncbi:hypothetical protein EZ313_04155 [Ramlibacter henchirensis]|uniref:Uncharacterized protein n=1 Tax=Ramlibacter henchirensis TaxID=204072 RepID=A0A4Z0C6Z8_9BURK|nr:hypothetical protein [Ramlibacter henchirensis]TFZ05855.1 hypothetical protein EZ313_04155 [Ramlibacter henchirensis]